MAIRANYKPVRLGGSLCKLRSGCMKGFSSALCKRQWEMPTYNLKPRIHGAKSAAVNVSARSSDVDGAHNKTDSKRSRLPGWNEARKDLINLGARSVNPARARQMASNEGFVLVDVRRENAFIANHIKGSVNVPLFSVNHDKLSLKLLESLLLSKTPATEFNISFTDQVMQKVESKDSPILLVCDRGGELEPSDLNPNGARSNSLLAMWLLINAGFTRVIHVRGGFAPKAHRPSSSSEIWLLKIFFPSAEYGMYSTELMAVAFVIPFLILAILAYPRLVEAYSDYVYGL